MILKTLFEDSVQALLNKSSTARLDVEILLEEVFGILPIQIISSPEIKLTQDKVIHFKSLLNRRLSLEPIAYILGYKEFYKSKFIVNKHVLVPRPETEFIVERALDFAKTKSGPLNILDLGAGSGCIGLSIIKELKDAVLYSVEISKEACAVISANSKSLDLAGRVKLLNKKVEDLGAQDIATDKFDIIVTNPPYIAKDDLAVGKDVQKFEPHLALYAEDNGYSCIKSWSSKALQLLKDSSIYLIEVGHDQSQNTRELLLQLKIFDKVEIINDYQGYGRIVCGFKGK